jgi:hypothetical protein
MVEFSREKEKLTEIDLRRAIEIREEYRKTKIKYDMYRLVRELMGKSKKSVMDFDEFRKNALSLIQGGDKQEWVKTK